MNDKDLLRIEQLEQSIALFRPNSSAQVPNGGWVRAIREALGMTNVQLAKRLGRKPQTIEDMQQYEAAGTIKLQTLRALADALECRFVYALVPKVPHEQLLRDRARVVAQQQLTNVAHSMNLEDQGVTPSEEERELKRSIEKLLSGNRKILWE